MLSLAGDAFLLLLDERTGKPVPDWWQLDRVLAGAVLADLEAARRITISSRFVDSVRGLCVLVVNREPTGDDVLDQALKRLDKSRRAPSCLKAVDTVAPGVLLPLLEQLTAAGFLRVQRRRILGVFPASRYEALRPEYRTELRAELETALLQGHRDTAAPRSLTLLGLLDSVNWACPVLGLKPYAYSGDARLSSLIGEVRRQDWRVDATFTAIDEYQQNEAGAGYG